MTGLSQEWAEKTAQNLYRTSNAIGHCITDIEQGIRAGSQAMLDESMACDVVYLSGTEVMRALREIAMRLDRAACIKSINTT